MRRRFLLLAALLLIPGIGCEEAPPDGQGKAFPDEFKSQLSKDDQGKVLARIGDEVITLADFERHLNSQPPYARARYASAPERQKEFLDNLVRFEVLAAEAAKRGYNHHPEVVAAMKQTMVRKMMSGDVEDSIKLADVSEQEMKAYYDEHKDEYHKAEEVRVSHILLKTKPEADKLLATLKEQIGKDSRNYRKLFADAAKASSIDEATKEQGGDLRFFARTEEGGAQPKAIADAAFAIQQVGSLGDVVQDDKGWHLLMLTGKKNRYDRDFESVKRQIQNRLFREKKRKATEDFVEKLRGAAKIERHDDLLAKIKPEPAEPVSAPLGAMGEPGAVPPLPPGVEPIPGAAAGTPPAPPLPGALPSPGLKMPPLTLTPPGGGPRPVQLQPSNAPPPTGAK